MIDTTQAYWMAFAHAKGFTNRRKMDFLIEVIHDGISLGKAMESIKEDERLGFDFTDKEWVGINEASYEIANYSFIAEQLINKGISIINIMDKFVYPQVLKKNLGKEAPILIYTKGNADLLKRNTVAIVGARKSAMPSLVFTKNVAEKAVKQDAVVVSGFAKGVDKCALDSALLFKGQSIIVLPQGIDTYTSKAYYPNIVNGDVLVLSTYHPQAGWSVGLAMDRNKTIYGLSNEIYAAESNSSGGTWEGVLNGLKRKRKVYVRLPEKGENNANMLLIKEGAIAVDASGNALSSEKFDLVCEEQSVYEVSSEQISDKQIVQKAISLLENMSGKGLTTSDLAKSLSLDDKRKKKLNKILSESNELLREKKGRYYYYYIKKMIQTQGTLF